MVILEELGMLLSKRLIVIWVTRLFSIGVLDWGVVGLASRAGLAKNTQEYTTATTRGHDEALMQGTALK